MIAKLRACEHALAGGVDDVVIVDGRDRTALEGAASAGRRPREWRQWPLESRPSGPSGGCDAVGPSERDVSWRNER